VTSQYFIEKNMVLVDYIGIFFYMWQYFWPHTVDEFLVVVQKLHVFVEIWPIAIYWSGKFTTQSYTCKNGCSFRASSVFKWFAKDNYDFYLKIKIEYKMYRLPVQQVRHISSFLVSTNTGKGVWAVAVPISCLNIYGK
jgi:hypothetical protein